MANNNLDNINIDTLKSFNDILRLNTAGMTSMERGQLQLINEEKEKKKQIENLIDASEQFGQELIGIGKSLSTGSSSFGPLTKTITLLTKIGSGMASQFGSIGKAIGAAIDFAGKVANTSIETFEKTYVGFEKLSQSGLVSSFEEIDKISESTMITINDLAELLDGQGQILAAWGGSAFKGMEEFKKLSGSLLTSRVDFQLLGITTKELTASQLKYMDYERRITGEQQKFGVKHNDKFGKYLNNIIDISMLTGQQRAEVEKEINLRQQETGYRIFIEKRTDKQNKADEKLLENTAFITGPTVQKGVRDLMVGLQQGVISTSEEADIVRQHYGRLGVDILATLQEHVLSPTGEVDKVINKLTSVNAKKINELGSQANAAGADKDSKIALEINNGLAFSKKTQKERDDFIAASKNKLPTETDTSLATMRIRMGDQNMMLQRLSMKIPGVTKSMQLLSKSMNKLIKEVFNYVGKDIPELLTVFEDQQNVQEDIADSIAKVVEYNKKQEEIDEKIKKLNDQRKSKGQDNRQLDYQISELTRSKELNSRNISKETKNQEILNERKRVLDAKREEIEIQQGTRPEKRTEGSDNTTNFSDQTGLAAIRELIASVESRGDYNIMVGGSTANNLTSMTIAQVQELQKLLERQNKGTAAGKYQYIYETLKGMIPKVGLDPNTTLFDQTTQDAFADASIRMRGYDDYKSGKITKSQFLNNLSMEWAGLPSPVKGGASYYEGVGNNKAHIPLDKALAQIGKARTGGIFNGPSTGYLIELHGRERMMIIPDNDGNSNMFYGKKSKQSNKLLTNLISMIDSNVDEMIDLINDKISLQEQMKAA